MHFLEEWHRRGCWESPLRNHSSSLEELGCGGRFHTSPTFSAARESIVVIPGERESSPSNAAINIRSSGEHRRRRVVYPPSASFFLATGRSAAPGAGTNVRSQQRQREPVMFDIADSIRQLRDGHVPTRRTWTIHESFLSVLNAQEREAAIVTVLRHQIAST